MNNVLIFTDNSDIDVKLMDTRYKTSGLNATAWSEYLYQLDPNITKVEYEYRSGCTTLTFTTESHKTWFILRWS